MSPGAAPPDRALFYERFADEFDSRMNRYEVTKRIRIVFEDVLPARLEGLRLLDAGCGTGRFSAIAAARGARVTALDVGERLLAKVAEKCDCERVVGSVERLPFADESFDVVLCSEVVEHLRSPRAGVGELARVVRPGGRLVLTTPNRAWLPALLLASALRMRPYEGIENWVWPRALRRWMQEAGLVVERFGGFNALPFVHPALYPVIDRLDALGGRRLAPDLMINVLVVATRPA
jgi:2-polyprenyl-3-methyl-5-hydroxy-6-metoxy-1,4-benzoquinol methylase